MGMQHRYDPNQLSGHLLNAFKRHGGLTLNEIAQLNGTRAPSTPESFNLQPMLDCFTAARRNGMKATPAMHIDGFSFKQAKSGDAVHVTDNQQGFNEYLGTLRADGQFYKTPQCTLAQKQAILAACADPLKAVLAFGKKFGRCSLCNRRLSDPVSIERGVGPICAEKFGLGL